MNFNTTHSKDVSNDTHLKHLYNVFIVCNQGIYDYLTMYKIYIPFITRTLMTLAVPVRAAAAAAATGAVAATARAPTTFQYLLHITYKSYLSLA